MKSYKHLSEGDRETIAYLKAIGKSIREIAFYLNRQPSSISREIRRNKEALRYRSHLAHRKAIHRRHHIPRKLSTLQFNFPLKSQVVDWLKQGWSPELVAGRLKLENHHKTLISHEAIYQWIYSKNKQLTKNLARSHRSRRKHRARPWPRRIIPQRVSILHRPEIINSRQVPGHWETDQMVGKGRTALQVLVERKTRFTLIARVRNKTAQASYETLVPLLSSLPPSFRQTITYDNGFENILHGEINQKFSMGSYFCEPYHSWEKGTVENTNGLIRRHLPKRTDFDTLPASKIKSIQDWINNRPKKCLNFKTPHEACLSEGVALAP